MLKLPLNLIQRFLIFIKPSTLISIKHQQKTNSILGVFIVYQESKSHSLRLIDMFNLTPLNAFYKADYILDSTPRLNQYYFDKYGIYFDSEFHTTFNEFNYYAYYDNDEDLNNWDKELIYTYTEYMWHLFGYHKLACNIEISIGYTCKKLLDDKGHKEIQYILDQKNSEIKRLENNYPIEFMTGI